MRVTGLRRVCDGNLLKYCQIVEGNSFISVVNGFTVAVVSSGPAPLPQRKSLREEANTDGKLQMVERYSHARQMQTRAATAMMPRSTVRKRSGLILFATGKAHSVPSTVAGKPYAA